MQARFLKKASSQTLSSFIVDLPVGIYQPYYYDLIGNVSTSRYRPGRLSPPGFKRPSQPGWLELRPRYPIVGGWNYSYTLGWDAPLEDSVKYEAKTGRYVLGVPFMTPIPGAAVNDAEVKIILPEGAQWVINRLNGCYSADSGRYITALKAFSHLSKSIRCIMKCTSPTLILLAARLSFSRKAH